MKTQSMTIFLLTIVFFYVSLNRTLAARTVWHSGQVTLWSNSVLNGDLSYNWCVDVVQVRHPNGRISTLSANQVREFGWFDFDLHKYRNFVSLSSPTSHENLKQVFFEVYMNGQLPVIRRLDPPHSWFGRVASHPNQYTDTPTLAQDTNQFLYFAYDEGQLLAVDHFYTDIYTPKMALYEQELKRFVNAHNLNESTLLGRLMLIDRYNFLSKQDQKSASINTIGKSAE